MKSDWMEMAYYWICPRISAEALSKGRTRNEMKKAGREREGESERRKGRTFSVNEQREIRVLSVLEHIGLQLCTHSSTEASLSRFCRVDRSIAKVTPCNSMSTVEQFLPYAKQAHCKSTTQDTVSFRRMRNPNEHQNRCTMRYAV